MAETHSAQKLLALALILFRNRIRNQKELASTDCLVKIPVLWHYERIGCHIDGVGAVKEARKLARRDLETLMCMSFEEKNKGEYISCRAVTSSGVLNDTIVIEFSPTFAEEILARTSSVECFDATEISRRAFERAEFTLIINNEGEIYC